MLMDVIEDEFVKPRTSCPPLLPNCLLDHETDIPFVMYTVPVLGTDEAVVVVVVVVVEGAVVVVVVVEDVDEVPGTLGVPRQEASQLNGIGIAVTGDATNTIPFATVIE